MADMNAPKFPLPKPLRKFLDQESSGGLIMMLAALSAMVLANGPDAQDYFAFTNAPVSLRFGDIFSETTLKAFVKDVLMVLFFFVVGLELKREFSEGFLSDRRQMVLPLVAAVAGMAVPAALYLAMNIHHPENMSGWAVSSATDIAFALAVLLLVGKSVPSSIKILLLAIAIFDDLGAILVIAFFYSSGIAMWPFMAVAIGCLALYGMARANVSLVMPYLLVGVYLAIELYLAGIHSTLAGVMIGLAMPMRCLVRGQQHSPVNQTLYFLHPWVSFLIVPLFAFVAGGVMIPEFSFSTLTHPLTLSIAAALVLGKQVGVFGTCYALIKTGICPMPKGACWWHIYGVSVLAGIGFTMSLFIGYLAFDDMQMDQVKLGILFGSCVSAVIGAVVFFAIGRKKPAVDA